ncbi:MAG TPA: shikimate kinase [Pseudomonadota bacterium]|nr:shikimate kinase [Xanthomonadales bacterium]HQW63345.1 shikimate kinase [Pseudomonadota bacterium]MBP7417210.1 shikimate kinase [Xanthomonadales bacterium]HQX24072.1 shikimate kinase [Pseudomonadota bacterium]HQY35108.1 shikimate kinase [Pseudomonadota bacterium]
MNPAPNVFLVGPMGAGKSTIGRRLARHFGLAFIDLDDELEARTGASVKLIFELEGEAGFRARESALLAELAQADGRLLATGGGTVLDAGNRALLRSRGFVVWLRASVAQQLRRLERDRKRPLLGGPDRRARLEQLAAERDPLYAEVADLTAAAEDLSAGVAAQHLAGELERCWQRSAARETAA